MNIKRWLIIFSLIIIDVYTKTHLEYTQILAPIQYHYVEIEFIHLIGLGLLLIAMSRFQYLVFPLAVCFTGSILNMLDGLNGVVINPFVGIAQGKAVGFNMADAAIILGAAGVIIEIFKNRRKIGSVEWKNV